MRVNKATTDGGFSRSARIGFWLGLVLFVVLLLLPPPASMLRAARTHFRGRLAAETRAILSATGHADAASDSPAWQKAEQRAVLAHARIMMGAAALTCLVAVWWIFVAIPIPVTSLLPLLLAPLLGILPIKAAAAPYADPNVFLFMGGFIIALGVERWGLHRRIALYIIKIVGTGRATIVLGFMIATALLSMWISNTATTMMMLPIGLAVIAAFAGLDEHTSDKSRKNFAAALMLGIAYSASIGGVGTPIGTPPNIVFQGQLKSLYPAAPEISFGHWMLLFLPLVVVFLPIAWLVITRIACRFETGHFKAGRQIVREQLANLGPLRGAEALMLAVFAATALLWMTRSIPIGEGHNVGWAWLLDRVLAPADGAPHRYHARYIHDALVALGMATLCFILPAGRDKNGRRQFLMNWETAVRLPWGILLLFGGGFSIATAFKASGLSLWCGTAFAELGLHSPFGLIVSTCPLVMGLTEITSNTATTQVMLPILAKVSQAVGVNPLVLMLPATISASCAFMLPVATPPNAIVFGSGKVEMGRMVRTGLLLNAIAIVLITLLIYFLTGPLLGVDLEHLPAWVH